MYSNSPTSLRLRSNRWVTQCRRACHVSMICGLCSQAAFESCSSGNVYTYTFAYILVFKSTLFLPISRILACFLSICTQMFFSEWVPSTTVSAKRLFRISNIWRWGNVYFAPKIEESSGFFNFILFYSFWHFILFYSFWYAAGMTDPQISLKLKIRGESCVL